MSPFVEGVAARRGHHFSKTPALEIELVAGHGVRGDGHYGTTVQHRYDRRRRPDAANLRQVHLIASETLAGARAAGFDVEPGDLGENLLTCGLDLFALPRATRLRIGDAEIEVTGLRSPCVLIDRFRAGLKDHFIERGQAGERLLRIGVMAIVTRGGVVRPGDPFDVVLPPAPHAVLEPV